MNDSERVVNVHDLARLQGTVATLRDVVAGLAKQLGAEAPDVRCELELAEQGVEMVRNYRKAAV